MKSEKVSKICITQHNISHQGGWLLLIYKKKEAELNTISLPKCQTAPGISACSRKVFYCYSWYCLFICALLLSLLFFHFFLIKVFFPLTTAKRLLIGDL